MIEELLGVKGALGSLAIALVIFGFAPGMALSLIVRLLPSDDPRRKELQAELYAVPRWERPFWVCEQFEVALRQGLFPEISWWFEFWGGRLIWRRAKLESGAERNRQHPETFWAPDAEAKAELQPGDLVKLMWTVKRGRGPSGERMWVKITRRDGDHLVGTLDNWPMVVYMRPDETIRFHIDDIIDCALLSEDDGVVDEAA